MEITSESIEDCLSQMEIDWMPFHDIYRSLFGFAKEEPNQVELEMTLRLTELLLKDYGVICLKGPEMTPFGEGIDNTIRKIRRITELEPYSSYNYGLWFDTL